LPQDLPVVGVGAKKTEELVEVEDLLDPTEGSPLELDQNLQATGGDTGAITVSQLVELLQK
jgi:hypothetical protein